MSQTMKPRQFDTPILKAVLDLSGGTTSPIKSTRIFVSILADMNLSEMDHGIQGSSKQPNVRRWYIGGLKNCQRHGFLLNTSRGFWALTETGLTLAQQAAGQAPVAVPDPVVDPETQAKVATAEIVEPVIEVETDPEPEVSPVLTLVQPEPVVEAEPEPVDAVFDPATLGVGVSVDYDANHSVVDLDPYLLSIMVEQTKCFGCFSTRSKTCEGCPLVAACRRQQIVSMSELAEEMNRTIGFDEGIEIVEAAQAATASVPTPEPPDLIGDLFEPPITVPDSAPTTQISNNAQRITAVLELQCEGCTNTIASGSDCQWVEGTGAYHTSCASHSA